MILSDDYLKLVGTASHLYTLNTESCSNISEEAIFKAKLSLPCLRSINISCNDQLSVLTVGRMIERESNKMIARESNKTVLLRATE